MKEFKEIICDGCGQVRRWKGFKCLDTCPCLEDSEEEPMNKKPEMKVLKCHGFPLIDEEDILNCEFNAGLSLMDKWHEADKKENYVRKEEVVGILEGLKYEYENKASYWVGQRIKTMIKDLKEKKD